MGKDQELLDAARNGNVAVVDKILAQRARRSGPLASLRRGPGANIQDSSGYTPLHHAALNGHKEIVRLLLAADASPSLVDQTGASPLHLAAWAGHPEIVRSLLAQNANPVKIDLATKTKETALHWAAQFGHVDVVSQLLARGADPLLKNAQGERPLDLAAQYGRLETVQHLLHIRPELVHRYRAPAASARIYRHTPLHRASKNGHEQVVEVLLAAGVDVNIRTESGTALHEAALCGKVNVVRTLLDHGAEVNMEDGRGRTVHHLLKQYTAPAHKNIKDTIESHRQSNGFESDLDDYPPFPVLDDNSPSYDKSVYCRGSSSDMESRVISMPAPETPSVKDHSINKASSSALIKHHSNNFVQKITSKCLGLKAKFNSAPNISKTGLGSEVELRSKENHSSEDRGRATNTLHIGNSRFFKILAKKRDEPIDVLCNDEFDTISLDRLITMDRLSIHNRSNRSCPGFKASLPNISENTELSSDSTESIEGSEFSVRADASNECVRVAETYNSVVRTSLPYAILETEMEDNVSDLDNKTLLTNSAKTGDAENDLYEAYSLINKTEKVSHFKTERKEDNVKPQRRNIIPQKAIDTIYENITFEYHIESPKAPTRTVLPTENTQGAVREPVYANLSSTLNESMKPVPAKRTLVVCNSNETITSYGSCSETTTSYDSCFTENADSSIHSSRTSTMSLDSRIDCSNFEDILLSKKSKSFRTPGHVHSQSSQDDEFSDSSSSTSATSSVVGESNSIEDVDCSSDIETVNGDYMSMSRTLPKLSSKPEPNRKLFRNITFSSATAAASCGKFKKHINENFVNYHIRGTGHCVYKAPTVQEFVYVFNKETLKDDDVPPFSKVPNDRESNYETAICFCRPDELKHHKSADDLTVVRGDESPKVYVDAESLLKRVAIAASSFRCYCDDGSCSLHHRWREAPGLAVKFHAFNRSVSTPDLTRVVAAAPKPVRLEDPYAIVDLSSVKFRQDSISSNDTSLTFGALSEPSTLSSLRRSGSADLRSECSSSTGTLRGSTSALNVASLDGGSRGGRGCVRSGSAARRWDEGDVLSEADALSVSSAASSSLPHHLHHHHHAYNKVSPTPPKKPPRRNLSVSPTHVNSPAVSYDQLRTHARSQDDLDDLQGAKHYLKHGRSVDQYVDSKYSYSECSEENHNSPRLIPVPNPRPSLKHRNQPVAITAMYENVVIKEQNPRRKLRRNFTHQYENFDPAKMNEQRKYSAQERSSLESLLDDVQSMNSPSDCERYYEGVRVPLSPTHYDQPPTPDHPPPSAKHAENSIHERIRPLSQEYKRRSCALRDSQTETETRLLRAASAASVASGATDRSANTDNCVEEYVCDVPFAGLFKGSTTTLDGIGLRPVPAERPKTLRKLKSVYDSSPTEPVASVLGSNGHERDSEDVVRRRSNTTSSNHSADKSLSILSPFDEQEEWAKISEIMASFGSKLVRESVFVSELEQEFTSRLGLSCSESSLSPSVVSSVGHWLNGIGLADFESLFIESGFDEVDFINGIIDENDLREMGIEEADRAKIIEAVKQLPLKIAEISTNHNNIYNNNNVSKPEDQTESVEEWLKNISLEQYSDTFRKHLYVDMDRVRRIWEVELTAVLEIQKPGHRKRILASVSGQQNGPANNMDDINADLNTLKNNIQQLKQEIKEKLPENPLTKTHPSLAPPGGETLKRSKKNRPAPQPPKPSDLEIRAPSELMVGVPGALKTQWRHQPFVLVSGAVTYVANYLGSTVVKELRGTESTKKSIQKLKKSTKEPRDSPDIILSISYRGVKFLNTITRELVCEHEIRNIHCACQDADDLTHFAYITKDHSTKSHYCHVFCVATMDQATEVILTLGEAFEVAYQMALREQFTKNSTNRILHGNAGPQQAKTPTHDPMTTSATKEKPNLNHGRSHSITEIKLNGHQLKIAPVPASLSNEDFQMSVKSDGSRSPRTPLLKAPIASTEEL